MQSLTPDLAGVGVSPPVLFRVGLAMQSLTPDLAGVGVSPPVLFRVGLLASRKPVG